MVNYNCANCLYETTKKSNYILHTNSVKHKKNINNNLDKLINECENKLQCFFCKKEFASKFSLKRHKNIGSCNLLNKSNPVKINTENKKLKEKMKHIIAENKLMKLQLDNVNKNTETGSRSVSYFNFVNCNFTNAPILMPIENSEVFLLNGREKKDLPTILIFHYKNETLYKYIGDLIVLSYKKKLSFDQAIWATDVARFNYVVRTCVNEMVRWIEDKNGELVKQTIINPVLKYAREILQMYFDENADKLEKGQIGRDRAYVTNMLDNCYKFINDIESGTITTGIIKYITPIFHLNMSKKLEEMKKILLIEEIHDNNILEQQIKNDVNIVIDNNNNNNNDNELSEQQIKNDIDIIIDNNNYEDIKLEEDTKNNINIDEQNKYIQKYYIKLEKLLHKTMQEQTQELQLQLENKQKETQSGQVQPMNNK
jgi:hypothetical protein